MKKVFYIIYSKLYHYYLGDALTPPKAHIFFSLLLALWINIFSLFLIIFKITDIKISTPEAYGDKIFFAAVWLLPIAFPLYYFLFRKGMHNKILEYYSNLSESTKKKSYLYIICYSGATVMLITLLGFLYHW